MADVPGDHGLAQAVGADQGEVSTLADELEGERALDQVALDLLGPAPVEVSDRLEASDAGPAQPALLAAPTLVDLLQACDFFQDLHRRQPALDGAREEVVEGACDGLQSYFEQARSEVSRVRH